MEQPRTHINYVRLLRRVVVHRWRTIVIAFAAIALPTVMWSVLSTEDTYEASATLFLIPERNDPAFLREFMAPEANALYQVILKSQSLAQAVSEALPKYSREELSRRMGFDDYMLAILNQIRRWRGQPVVVYSPSELAVRELKETRMSFDVKKDGTLIIKATAFTPRVAVDLANTYVDVLLSRSSAFARQQARGTRELLENLATQAKSSQGEAEDALRRFQAQTGVVKIPEQARTDLQLLAQLDTQLADIQVNKQIARNRLAYLKGEQKDSTPTVDPTVHALRERLGQVSGKLAALTEKYTDRHPLVRSAQGELEDAEERLKAALAGQQVPRPAGVKALKPTETAHLSKQMASLEVELMSLQSREAALQQRIALLKRATAAMGAREQEYSTLARGLETQARLTTMLTDKLTAARISEQTHIRNLQVIDLAALPQQPSPKKMFRQILLGLVGGLGIGVALAFLREHASQVVETEQDAATSGLPILGSIPIAPAISRAEGANGHPRIFVATSEPHSLPADACRAIRTAIDCKALDGPIRTLLVTSPGAHDGKSTVLVNLALAFAEAGRRVMVIDADMRRPTLHKAFEIPNEIGLADMLKSGIGWTHAARNLRPDLTFLPSGAKVQNPGGLLSSRQMAQLVVEARERADVVLIDSPPLLAVSDALPLAGYVDGVLLVARFAVTRRSNLERVKDQLDRVRARVVGVVVNGLSPRETRRYYAEYDHYVGAGLAGRKRKQIAMKALFKKTLIALCVLGSASVATAQEDYRIGTDDVLHVIVWDNKDLEQTLVVRPDGKISYPLAGEIQAEGRTVPQLTDALRERLSTAVKNPNVSVMVKEIRSFRVHFVGRVARPGVYRISAGMPLLQALTLAGGASEGADLPAAYIIRGDQKLPIDLRKLIQEGDLTKNVKVEREDTIVIPEISIGSNPQEVLDRRIYLLGRVAKPGVYTIKQDVPILHALFLAGGAVETGDLASAFVIRGKQKIPVDLWRLTHKGDLSQNVTITHEDTIVVPPGGELQNAVYVMGEVNKPGVYAQPEALSLLRLVSLAGGFTKFAAPNRATLIRRNGDAKTLMKIDLKNIMNDPKTNEDLALRPGDVLIVPERLF